MTRSARALPIVLAIVAFAGAASAAAAADCLPLTPRHAAGNYIVPGVLGDIAYRTIDGATLALDAYVQQGAGARPLVVVVPGGALGSRVAFVGQFLETLTDAGFNWVVIDYRRGATAAGDVAAALAFVRCHAAALQTDAARLVLLGEDTGADVAAAVAGLRPVGLAATVLIGGRYESATTREPAPAQASPPTPTSALAPPAAPAARPAPVLAIHGGGDTEVPAAQAAAFCTATMAGGGSCQRLVVAGASHRAENWWPRHWGYKRRLVEWLTDRVGSPGEHLPYRTRLEKRLVFDAAERLTLDFWRPAGRGPFPLVVLVHGGGWEAGDRVTYLAPLFAPLAAAGFAWCSIDYRLTPQVHNPAQLRDLRTALAWLRAGAGRLRIDPARIVIVGESASGQMVMQVGADDRRLAGIVSFYGVYDFLPMVTDASPRSLLARLFGRATLDDDARAVMKAHSPLYHVHRRMPPVLLVHGTNERLWEQGVAMNAALERAGADVELVRLDGAPHGMENWEGDAAWSAYKARVVTWLRRRFTAP